MKIPETIKFSILFLAVAVTFSSGRFSLLDELLLVYIGAALLFQWSGGFVVGIGLIMQLLVVLSRYNNQHDLSLIAPYPVWLIGSGVFLLLLPKTKDMVVLWRQHKDHGRIFLAKVYSQWKEGFTGLCYFLLRSAREAYQQWFGRFSLAVRCKIIFAIVIVPALFISTSWSMDSIFLIASCIWLLLFVRDSRIAIAGAGLSFLGAALFAILHRQAAANLSVEYGYYFSCMIVLVEIKRMLVHVTRSRPFSRYL